MSIELVVGIVAFIVAVAAIAVAVCATGAFEYLGGKRAGPSPEPKDKLLARLLAVNCPGLPYQVRRGKSTDIVIEWKIVDADWHEVLSREQVKETYLAFLLLDETRHAARYWEIMGRVDWTTVVAGLPQVSWRKEFIRGRVLFRKSWGARYDIRDDGTPGKAYEYRFDVRWVRDPVIKVVREAGWEFVPVLKREHAKYDKEAIE
ncbi:MAG: hypothetical protein AB1597_04780 [Chloroflexota bacterium]